MSISVAIATYNGGKFIKGQIDSIANQQLQPDEVIVCDDRSTDNTATILKTYKENGFLTYEVNESQLGVVRNFKKAVSISKPYNWVALSDQDDIWLTDKLQDSAALLSTINDDQLPCIVYSDLILIDDTGELLAQSFQDIFGFNSYAHNLTTLLFSNFVTGCTVLMNEKARTWFLEMPDDVRSHDEWIALIAFTFGKAARLKKPMVRYRKHAENVSLPIQFESHSRFKNFVLQIKKALTFQDDFLVSQFAVVQKFYEFYYAQIPSKKKPVFERFLKLRGKPYLIKKLAYRQMVHQNRKGAVRPAGSVISFF